MKSFLKKENGAAAVFVALGMTLLLGCAALAVDLGASYHARIDLQDAVDNAAYAAGSLLPSNKNAAVQNKVTAAVEASLRANGVDPEEIEKLLSEARADERRKLEGAISIKESMLDGLRQTNARLEDENHRLQLVITDLQANWQRPIPVMPTPTPLPALSTQSSPNSLPANSQNAPASYPAGRTKLPDC